MDTSARQIPTPNELARRLAEGGHAPDARRFGSTSYVVDPASTGEYASQNRNHVEHFGVDGQATEADLDALLSAYAAAGVAHWFFYVSPSEQADDVRRWLGSRGLSKEPVGLSMLCRNVGEPPRVETSLRVAKLTSSDAPELQQAEARWAEGDEWGIAFLRGMRAGLERDDVSHHAFVALEGDAIVAVAVLDVRGELGLLRGAATLERHRRRGAQRALIAARLATARELGCRWAVSETYFFLRASYGNLKASGFREVYRREIWKK